MYFIILIEGDIIMKELGIFVGMKMETPVTEQLRIIKDAGFSSFFTGWSKGRPIDKYADTAAKLGLTYQTLHAPFSGMNCIWEDGIDGDNYQKIFTDCIDDCSANGIGIMVTHVTVATVAPPPSDIGAYRFGNIIEHAAKKNVTIALESLEIPEHLAFLFEKYGDASNLGFCHDCGHNLCYTPDIDMMALYGNRLVCTHMHDNFGVKTPGVITYHDDLHYLPFDGKVDYKKVGEDMKKYGKNVPVTLELNYAAKPEYKEKWTEEEFIYEAYLRAVKIAAMCE